MTREKKGDNEDTAPIEVVSVASQRDALAFVLENSFRDESFGLTPELLRHLSLDKWLDQGGFRTAFQDATYPLHDRVMAIQASVLTMLMNPTNLRRIFDNECRLEPNQDALTLPELLDTIAKEVWSELDDERGRVFVVTLLLAGTTSLRTRSTTRRPRSSSPVGTGRGFSTAG